MTLKLILLIIGALITFLLIVWIIMSKTSMRYCKRLAKPGNRSFAHRGLHDKSLGIPENSMAAFKRALDHGFGFELDVRLTKDGVPVIMHDNAALRMTGTDCLISDSTFEQLQYLRLAGTSEKIPMFSDVLSLVDGKQAIIVEVKTNNDCDKVCRTVAELLDKYSGDFMVESFDPAAVRWFRKNRPDYVRGQLVTRFSREGKKKPLLDFLECFLLFNILGRPDFIAVNVLDVNIPGVWLNRVLFGAKEIRWTVRTPEEHRAAIDKNASSIFENFIPEQ